MLWNEEGAHDELANLDVHVSTAAAVRVPAPVTGAGRGTGLICIPTLLPSVQVTLLGLLPMRTNVPHFFCCGV